MVRYIYGFYNMFTYVQIFLLGRKIYLTLFM